MAVIDLDTMNEALSRFNRLIAVHDTDEQPTDISTVMTGYLGIDEEAFDVLTLYIEEVGDPDPEAFMAGVVCGAMILKEADGALAVVPDAPPPDLAA